jgi:hypothetical protein
MASHYNRDDYSSVSNPDNNGHQQSIKQLDAKLKALSTQLKAVANTSDVEELHIIIYKKGFTTIAELTMLLGIVDSVQEQVKHITALRNTLLSGSRAVKLAETG